MRGKQFSKVGADSKVVEKKSLALCMYDSALIKVSVIQVLHFTEAIETFKIDQ